MKRSVLRQFILSVGIVLLAPFAISDANASFTSLPSASIQKVATTVRTPEQVARYIFRNFLYEADQRQFGNEEHWQSPDELMRTRRGDCEDFALFATEVLKANGFTAFLVNVYGHKFAHTVAVFKENGKFNIIDGDKVKRYNANSLDELFNKVYPHWDKAAMVTFSQTKRNGQIMKMWQS